MPVTLTVKNFQSIKSAKVVIDGFTVIYGPNNSGKTALIRAVRGVFQNTQGTAFVRRGTAKCSVKIDMPEVPSIQWEKGEKIKPTYVIGKGKPIHPGRAVPQEVLDLGVRPLRLSGNREIWPQIAPQFTGQVFLLDLPGSVLAEAIADVERVTHLNSALKLSESDRRSAGQELKVRRIDRDALRQELDGMAGLDAIILETAAIEKRVKKTRTIGKAIFSLTQIQGRLAASQKAVADLAGIEEVSVPSAKALQKPQDTLDELEGLRDLQERWRAYRANVDALEPLQEVSGQVGAVDTTRLDRVITALGTVTDLKTRWDSATQEVSDRGLDFSTAKRDAEAAELGVQVIIQEMGVCPICGTETETG